jgi:threonine aldolase
MPSVPRRQFASDNNAGIAPEAFAAMQEANSGHEPSYGDDRWTAEAADLLRALFRTDCDVYFAFNGTAANSLALASLTQSYHSVLCHETAHLETDECGAPEFFSNGTKVLTMPGAGGKVTPAGIRHLVEKRADIHYPKPKVVSVTQATEVGTVYSVDELRAIGAEARALGLRVHMDGARLANAVASLDADPAELTTGRSRRSSPTAASRRVSSRPRCASWRPPGSGSSAAAPGCATPLTPTPWPGSSTRGSPRCGGSPWFASLRRTASS